MSCQRNQIMGGSPSVGTLIFLVFFTLPLLTCLNPFAPKLEESADLELIVTNQQSPDEVLQNFKLAYFFRDSILYSDVLDSSFIFYYFDYNLDASGRYDNWGRDTDLRTTGRLFRIFDVINLVWESTGYQDTLQWDADAEPQKIEIIKQFSLKLVQSDAGVDYDFWGKAYFTFIKSRYDYKWRIIRWRDQAY